MEQVIDSFSSSSGSYFGILEVLDRSGKVVQRTEVNQNALTIGRAYDNDIILDDLYVCPEHVSVMMQGGTLVVNDLNSINGISQNKYHFKGEKLKLSSNETFRVGHTTLRYRSANSPLHPTKIDRHIRNSFWSLQNPVVIFMTLLILTGFIVVEAIISQAEETENLKIMAEAISAVVLVFSWAGLWALFGKLVIHRFSFLPHLGIFSLANVGFYLSSTILGYVCFAVGFDRIFSTSHAFVVACICIWMLLTHLGYSTKMSFRSMLTASLVLILIGTGFYFLQLLVIESEFNYLPGYEVILKSPEYNFVAGDSLENFFADSEELRDHIEGF